MSDPIAKRLAVVVSHPIQYYSPWFRHLAAREEIDLKVFYLWDFGITETTDEKFGTSFTWDIPLLDGYDYELVENVSKDPGTHHFRGLDNPELVPALVNWKPDAILIFGYNYASHTKVIRAPELKGIPMFFRGDSHNLYPVGGIKQVVGRFMRRILFRRFDRFLTVGTANEDYFRFCGVPDEKFIRAAHCVDNNRFRDASEKAQADAKTWRQELGIPKDSFVFLFAGKFESKKRPLDLLEAFQKINLLHTSLLLIGGGEHEEELREKAGERVFFAPFQNQSQMPKVYATGNILILPSFGRGETWGLAVNEAMNLGTPAIVSSHVGCGPDLVMEGETGWIFQAGSAESLAEVMEKAAADPKRTSQIGETARDRVASFSYEAAAEGVVKALQETT